MIYVDYMVLIDQEHQVIEIDQFIILKEIMKLIKNIQIHI